MVSTSPRRTATDWPKPSETSVSHDEAPCLRAYFAGCRWRSRRDAPARRRSLWLDMGGRVRKGYNLTPRSSQPPCKQCATTIPTLRTRTIFPLAAEQEQPQARDAGAAGPRRAARRASPERLKKVPLPETLYEAIRAAQGFTKMEAPPPAAVHRQADAQDRPRSPSRPNSTSSPATRRRGGEDAPPRAPGASSCWRRADHRHHRRDLARGRPAVPAHPAPQRASRSAAAARLPRDLPAAARAAGSRSDAAAEAAETPSDEDARTGTEPHERTTSASAWCRSATAPPRAPTKTRASLR